MASDNAIVQLKKIGTKYRLFAVQGGVLKFYGELEVGSGFPEVDIPNELKKEDAGKTKTIDGKAYVIGGYGGTARATPGAVEKNA